PTRRAARPDPLGIPLPNAFPYDDSFFGGKEPGMADEGLRVGFLGAGQMATALARGWLAAGLVRPGACRASDPLPQARESFSARTGCPASPDNRAVVAASDLIVLAVKPQSLPALLAEVRGEVQARSPLVVSVAAGVPLRQLAEGLGPGRRLVRVMPNTPCLLGASASGYSPGEHATPEDVALVDKLLGAVGRAF